MPAIAALVLGLGLGWACGGRAANLAKLRIRFEIPILVLFVLQAVARDRLWGAGNSSTLGLAAWILTSIGLATLLALNHRVPGLPLAGFGLLLNLDAVVLNGFMPAVGSAVLLSPVGGGFYGMAGQSTIFVWIADVMPLGARTRGLLLSVGDVVLLVAVTCTIIFAMNSVGSTERGQ